MAGRTASLPDSPDPGPISPELALVDPELRRRATAALPESSGQQWPRPEATRRWPGGWTEDSGAPHEDAPPPDSGATERPRTRRRLRLLVVTGGLVAAAAVTLATAGARRLDVRAIVAEPRQQPAAPQVDGRPRSLEPAPAPQAPAKPRKSRKQTPAVAPAAAERTFVWPPVAGADYYRVQFFTRGRKVFEAWPRSTRLVIAFGGTARPRGFRFSPGRYRWIVRPGFGARARGRYGPPIVVSTWTLTRPARTGGRPTRR